MRSVLFVALLALAACESDMKVQATQIVWMEWPAEVQTFDPFRARLVVWQPCAIIRGFEPSPATDAVSVTFAPYFLVDKQPVYCLNGQGYTSDFTVNVPLDTAGTAPGLPFERVYEMRGAVPYSNCAACAVLNSAPWLSFGFVTVRPTVPPTTVRNAAGTVFAQRDSVGCTRIRPSGLLGPNAEIVVENPPDTTAQWPAFVHGYIYEPAAPVCGETKVFHLTGQWSLAEPATGG
ncbi:MAG TPA: hypothetical protein VGQ18_15940 [Gemmatimonadales bacterium]|jgi:hypothetical protein|nr:hypothetical protein [Gemmatimonadales bacterium]